MQLCWRHRIEQLLESLVALELIRVEGWNDVPLPIGLDRSGAASVAAGRGPQRGTAVGNEDLTAVEPYVEVVAEERGCAEGIRLVVLELEADDRVGGECER